MLDFKLLLKFVLKQDSRTVATVLQMNVYLIFFHHKIWLQVVPNDSVFCEAGLKITPLGHCVNLQAQSMNPVKMSVCLHVSSRYVASLSCGLTPLREWQIFIAVLCCDKPYSVFLQKLRFCSAELQILQLAELFAGSLRDGAVTRAVKPAKGIMGWRQFGIPSQLIVVAYTAHGGSTAKTYLRVQTILPAMWAIANY